MSYLPIFQTNADKKLEQLEKENAELRECLFTERVSDNEIKAQAVEDAFNAFNHNVIDSRNCLSLPQREWLRCYINKLRGK